MEYDAIVAGAGIWGSTLARRLAESGRRVLVLEKRAAVGGNCRAEIDPGTGIEVHVYGSHIFHTDDERVWNFVNRFTAFNGYRHTVLARHAGRIYHLPIGKTLYAEFGTSDPAAVFDAFIRNYTAKQWGMDAGKVDPAVIRRLKVRDSYSTDYFDDRFQGIPLDGYNRMFERMLDHGNIEVKCNSAFALASVGNADVPVYYSGPIDELFGYMYGPLPWRTLRFETETPAVADYQCNAVVNYVDADVPYTRIHEFRHYHPGQIFDFPAGRFVDSRRPEGKTVIMREYPSAWRPGDEPYYPIASAESAALYAKYREAAAGVANLVAGGRLGAYRYLDMDDAVAAALEVPLDTPRK